MGVLFCVFCVISFYSFDYFRDQSTTQQQDDWLLQEQQTAEKKEAEKNEAGELNNQVLMIDLKGAVQKPGVYTAIASERVIDLVDRAGGLTDEADEKQINFAMHVEDEMVIYIPTKAEEGHVDFSTNITTAGGSDGGKVNINKGSQEELETLPGIGPSKASAIIEYREKNGPFKAIEDLMSISGIGEKTFEKLKAEITVK
ncbi:helix-hairpin-helix domain-containing protein [Bacillus aquiflavi]|uniref:Helix-hairpin-helix domain-containing protein n=2 Tax=Bacillus aquiflavi TaxID=2672567 RepID=A0A6B3VWV7_9BACI|nr:helix-hairpin-helix domain-containing protein [Bacillus aquiflavi]NEY80273.1 hypothetical protein [Bacillus aquiflavi]UAC50066.1 helix-hairpin-helix domain-containing protein [Bacillus aquiflavi]